MLLFSLRVPQVLPDVSGWPYVGEEEINSEPVHLWRYEQK